MGVITAVQAGDNGRLNGPCDVEEGMETGESTAQAIRPAGSFRLMREAEKPGMSVGFLCKRLDGQWCLSPRG